MSGERKPKRRSLGDDRGLTPEPKPRWHYEKTMLHRDGVRMFLAYPAGDAEGAWIADVLNERDDRPPDARLPRGAAEVSAAERPAPSEAEALRKPEAEQRPHPRSQREGGEPFDFGAEGAYEIWDFERGNLLAVFDSEAEALASLHEIAQSTTGDPSAFGLVSESPQGESQMMFTGSDVLHRADSRHKGTTPE